MLLHDLRKRIAERLRIHRDIKRLKRLDDHLLADVGIHRDQIADCVSGRC
jgi:uncharacterized protein YjiS (DUF1127 family)